MKRFILLSIFSFSFFTGFSQTTGVVIDIETLEPIPYANICIKSSNFGTTSNTKGEFTIYESLENALLIVSTIGYEKETIAAKEQYIEIYLKPKVYELKEVSVKPNRTKTKLIVNSLKNKKSNHSIACNGYSWIAAKYFKYQPEYTAVPYIKSIKILTNSRISNAKFNVRLLSADENGEPSAEIFENNIIVSARWGKKPVIIDLSDKHIRFPENGFFVALEWFVIEENAHHYSYTNKGSREKLAGISYEPKFSVFKKYGESDTWHYIGGKWYKISLTPNENEYLDLAIELTLTN